MPLFIHSHINIYFTLELYMRNIKLFLPNAEITVPNVTRDLLMFAPSFNLLPVAPVEFALSL